MLSRLSLLALLAAALLLAASPAAQSQTPAAPQPRPLILTPDVTLVVLAKNAPAPEQQAAKLLQTWLRKTCNVATGFEIKTEPDAAALKNKIAIAVGSTSLAKPDPRVAKLNDDGFLIHREGAAIAITGHTANATYYGAVAFLDRYAGVRFYMPGDLWTSRSARHIVVFDGKDFLSQPFVVSGFMTGFNTKPQGDDDWLNKIGGSRRKGGTHQHNLYTIFPPEKFAATHPEIYPIYDGQRYIPKDGNDQNWQIDFTEPYTLEAAKQTITEYFQKTPDALYIAVSVNDSYHWSESERNQKIIAEFQARDPKGQYTIAATSDIYWRFMNQLAAWLKEKFPNKLLVALAYAPTSTAPSYKIADNIVVFTNLHLSELPYYLDTPGKPPAALSQWLAVAKHFGNHEWYEGIGFLLPRFYSGYWSQFLRLLTKHFDSTFMHAEGYPNWGFDGPKYYFLAKMWWDPQADPKALTRQFCDDLFGPAAKAMNDYFTQLEALWIQLDLTDGPRRRLTVYDGQFGTTPASRALIEQCHHALQQAAAAAQTDEQKQRVALFAKCFAFSESLFDLAAKPTDAALHDHAVALAQDLAKDKWAFYIPAAPEQPIDAPMKAIQAIYKGPVKTPAAP